MKYRSPEWMYKNEWELHGILRRKGLCGEGLFIKFADELPHPFGYYGFRGVWHDGSCVYDLKLFYNKYKHLYE